MSYLLVFDIKKENASLRVKVNRMLNKIKAKIIQDSVWECNNLRELKSICKLIKSNGGKVLLFHKKHLLK